MNNENDRPVGAPVDLVSHPDVPDSSHPTEPEGAPDPPDVPTPYPVIDPPAEPGTKPVPHDDLPPFPEPVPGATTDVLNNE